MKTILVPTDFSKNAYSALYYATQIFEKETCNFIIIHSFEKQVANLTSRIDIAKTEAVVDELYDTTEASCEVVKEQIIKDTNNKNHTYSIISTTLTLTRAINKLIVKESADYVVMGSKGSTGALETLMGSNTLSMIQKIKNAALLIIPNQPVRPTKQIAFATGFKRPYKQEELKPLVAISSINDAEIKVVHVNKQEKMTEAQLANSQGLFELLETEKTENTWLLDNGDTYDTINSYINESEIDLLAMILYKHTAIVRLFREATVKNIAKQTAIPFLILPKVD
ncbi:universal stress protein [unidentified eubacterium SCB49]|nr:universal stress protein [unidentified eubacterium SCB49]